MLHRRKDGIGFVVDHKCGSHPSERDILEMIKAQKELFSTVLSTCLSQRCIGFLKCSSFEAASHVDIYPLWNQDFNVFSTEWTRQVYRWYWVFPEDVDQYSTTPTNLSTCIWMITKHRSLPQTEIHAAVNADWSRNPYSDITIHPDTRQTPLRHKITSWDCWDGHMRGSLKPCVLELLF